MFLDGKIDFRKIERNATGIFLMNFNLVLNFNLDAVKGDSPVLYTLKTTTTTSYPSGK